MFADVDECGDNNGGCSQLCVNEEPGFSCDCTENFELDNDGRTCKRTYDEVSYMFTYYIYHVTLLHLFHVASFPCEVDNNCEQDCDGATGVPDCSCRSGYVLAEDMEKCNGTHV